MYIRSAVAILALLAVSACRETPPAGAVGSQSTAVRESSASTRGGVDLEAVETADRVMLVMDGLVAHEAANSPAFPVVTNYAELTRVLVPAYLPNLPTEDAWGTPFRYAIPPDSDVGVLGSAAGDKTFQTDDIEFLRVKDPKMKTGSDFMASRHNLFQYPSLGTVEKAEPNSVDHVRSTFVFFGPHGRYLAAHGVIGNSSPADYRIVNMNVIIGCKEQPGFSMPVQPPRRFLAGTQSVPYLAAGTLDVYRFLAEVEVERLPTPCTRAPQISFHEFDPNQPLSIHSKGENRIIDASAPAGGVQTSPEAREGMTLDHVAHVRRRIDQALARRARDAGYAFSQPTRVDDMAWNAMGLGLTEADSVSRTTLALHFGRMVVDHDWSPDYVDTAVASAQGQLLEYLRTGVKPPPDLNEFRLKNFEVMRNALIMLIETELAKSGNPQPAQTQ